MALFKCEKCGATKEGRCKPKKCPQCEEAGCMVKEAEEATPAAKKCGGGCRAKK